MKKPPLKVKECKICNTVQPVYYAGVYGDGKTKIYTNADGQRWNGSWCSLCNIMRARLTMQELRKKRRNEKV